MLNVLKFLLISVLLFGMAPQAMAVDTTFYIGSMNAYKLNDSTFTIYAENKSPAVHNASVSNFNDPLGCEFPQKKLTGPLYMFYQLENVYQVALDVFYTDGTIDARQYGVVQGPHTHYVAAGSGETASCLANPYRRCFLNFNGSGSIGTAGWTGQQALVIPKIPGKIVKGVARNSTTVNTCYVYVKDGAGRIYPEYTWLTAFADPYGVFDYNPNTPTCTVTAPTLNVPAGTTAKAVTVAVGGTFGPTASQNIAINCSGKSTGGMTITVGNATTAHASVNAANNNGIMANTGTAAGTSVKLSFTGSTGGDCAVTAAPMAFGVAQNLCNGKNLTVGVQGQLARTAAVVGPGTISNSLVVNLQYN